MKYFFLIFSFFLFSLNSISQKTDCESVRSGTFKSVLNTDGEEFITMIYREKDKQIEENKAKGIKMEFVVKWTSLCTYELSKPKLIKGNLPGVSETQVVYVKIIEVTKEFYKAEVTTNFFEGKAELDFLIIK